MSAFNLQPGQAEERLTVARAQTGDREAFGRLVEKYDKRLLYFILRVVGNTDDAYDVLQSVWLQVYRRLGTLQSPAAFRVWLYRIAHTQAVTEVRKKTRRPIGVEDLPEQDEGSTIENEAVENFDNAELVHLAMESLSVDHRRVLTLRFLEDMSIEEIAEVIDAKPGTVKSRLHYARLTLSGRIQELLDE